MRRFDVRGVGDDGRKLLDSNSNGIHLDLKFGSEVLLILEEAIEPACDLIELVESFLVSFDSARFFLQGPFKGLGDGSSGRR